MAKISKEILAKLVKEEFFDNWKTLEQVLKRLSQKGFTIKGRKVGLVAQLLTFLCQEDILERDEIKNSESSAAKWRYRKSK